MARYATVYPLVTTRALARPFTYELVDGAAKGAVVSVPLGRSRRRGVVVELVDEPPAGIEPVPIDSVLDELPPVLVDLALWVADYYGSTPGRALELIAPVKRKRRKEQAPPGERQALVDESEAPELTAEQRAALERITASLEAAGGYFLLYGETGSGKTEVYLQACAAALARGKTAIVLVPEIALTPQTLGRFQARFGDAVALLHSGLTDAERRDERERIARGEAKVVVGARSAIFAPLRDVGVICVDEEHDPSYKQESDPRYDARTVAAKRAALEDAVAGEASVLEGMRLVAGLAQVSVGEGVDVDDQDAAVFQVADVRLQGGRIHGDQHVRLVAGGLDVVRREGNLVAGHARQRPGRCADLGREVRKRGQIVADQRRGVRELRPGQLHAVARVAGEPDDNGVELRDLGFGGNHLDLCTHCVVYLLRAGLQAAATWCTGLNHLQAC